MPRKANHRTHGRSLMTAELPCRDGQWIAGIEPAITTEARQWWHCRRHERQARPAERAPCHARARRHRSRVRLMPTGDRASLPHGAPLFERCRRPPPHGTPSAPGTSPCREQTQCCRAKPCLSDRPGCACPPPRRRRLPSPVPGWLAARGAPRPSPTAGSSTHGCQCVAICRRYVAAKFRRDDALTLP